jgi:hypothetical protein
VSKPDPYVEITSNMILPTRVCPASCDQGSRRI